jgi:hypothetical protein
MTTATIALTELAEKAADIDVLRRTNVVGSCGKRSGAAMPAVR